MKKKLSEIIEKITAIIKESQPNYTTQFIDLEELPDVIDWYTFEVYIEKGSTIVKVKIMPFDLIVTGKQ